MTEDFTIEDIFEDGDNDTKQVKAAKNKIVNSLKAGTLKKPNKCSKCGKKGNVEAHHKNGYNKNNQFTIIWLCMECHKKEHVKLRKNKMKKKDSFWYHEAIVENKEKFIAGSFRYRNFESGVSVSEGKLITDPQGSLLILMYEFDSEQFTEDQAKAWLSNNKINVISFKGAEKTDSVIRYDVMDFTKQYHTKPFKVNNDGSIEGQAICTNVGVFTYRDSKGNLLRELRPPEEVFNPDSTDTLKNISITNDHPPERINIDNKDKFEVGLTGNSVSRDAFALSVPMKITDKKTINEINSNDKKSLSCGYSAILDYSSGNWLGVHYDAIQRDIKYNHIAVVGRGRAGDLAKIVLRTDSTDAILIDEQENNKKDKETKGGKRMIKIMLDGIEYEASPEVANALKKANERADTAEASLETLKTKNADAISKIEADRDTFKDENVKLKKDIEDNKLDDNKIKLAVDERLSIVEKAKSAGIEVKDEMSNLDLKKEIIMKNFPNANLDNKDEVYLNARYDSAIEILNEKIKKDEEENADEVNKKNKKKVFTDHNDKKDDKKIVSSKERRDKYIEDLENECKNNTDGKSN